MLRITLAVIHLLGLAIGPAAIWARARSLSVRPLDIGAMRRAFTADSWWGIAAIVWIASGLWRLFGSTEKSTTYYTHNEVFLTKMRLFLLIFVLEIWPMITLIRWRGALRREREAWHPNETIAGRIAAISYLQVALIVGMIIAAVMMARGYGYHGGG